MMRKFLFLLIQAVVLINTISYAGTWYILPSTGKWYYLQSDDTFAKGKWIEDEGKHYFFDESGALLVNTITPDGYTVDNDGAWIKDIPKYSVKSIGSANTIDTNIVNVASSSSKKKELKSNILSKKNVEYIDSVKIGSKNWANAIKFSGNDSFIKANSGDYNFLSFEAGIKEINDNAEYLLTIFVNGDEAEVIDEFSSDGEVITLNLDLNSEIMLIYTCTVESGTYLSANSKALYIRKAQFEKVRE